MEEKNLTFGSEKTEREDAASRMVSGGKPYSLEYIQSKEGSFGESRPLGEGLSWYDISVKKWIMQISLEESRLWFLTVVVDENGNFIKYSFDEEAADDSHYEFYDEKGLREAIYAEGDENLYLAEVMIRYIKENGALKLLYELFPFVTHVYHFD